MTRWSPRRSDVAHLLRHLIADIDLRLDGRGAEVRCRDEARLRQRRSVAAPSRTHRAPRPRTWPLSSASLSAGSRSTTARGIDDRTPFSSRQILAAKDVRVWSVTSLRVRSQTAAAAVSSTLSNPSSTARWGSERGRTLGLHLGPEAARERSRPIARASRPSFPVTSTPMKRFFSPSSVRRRLGQMAGERDHQRDACSRW